MLVIDASVVVKWLFNDPEHEDWTARATALMEAVVRGDVAVLQPPHWPAIHLIRSFLAASISALR